VCRNPLIGAQRARKRDELLAATETDLAAIAYRVDHGTLLGGDQIGLAVGPALKRYPWLISGEAVIDACSSGRTCR